MADAKQPPAFAYRWFSRRLMPERRGKLCRIVSWSLKTQVGGGIFGTLRVVRVEFEDGFQVDAQRGMFKGARQSIAGVCTKRGCKRQIGRSGSHRMCRLHAARAQRQRDRG